MNRLISVIIPNHNGSLTIGKCLEAVFASDYDNFEVIVVDDCSTDNSVEIIKKFPCRLIQLDKHSGASKARNTGALNSNGEILFFIDADCILQKDTLMAVNKAFEEYKERQDRVVIGGTYTKIPYDATFFSTFQSIFVNYSETKSPEPDYIAAHAMAIDSNDFRENSGFPEKFLPIIEDVEFSHRLRRAGYRLVMRPEILVQHIFNFNLIKSLRNAFRKSLWWTIYSLKNKDLLSDSGTASVELKANVVSCFLIITLVCLFLAYEKLLLLIAILLILSFNLLINKKFFTALYHARGLYFAIPAMLYYIMLYPIAVGAGAFTGMLKYKKISVQDII